MNTVYLLLGSNEGNRQEWLDKALTALQQGADAIIKVSPVFETAAWGKEDQPAFLNMAVALETPNSPKVLLNHIQQIELNMGRQRTVKWGQRTLDIDILFFNNDIIDIPALKVPHPHLHERRFTLAPLAAIAGTLVHPVLKRSVNELLAACQDELAVTVFKE